MPALVDQEVIPSIRPRPVASHYNYPYELNKKGRYAKWTTRRFLCWDGEGYDIDCKHQYVYLCAYNGNDYTDLRNDAGLGTVECFEFLLETATADKQGINVIYGGSYDNNMMLQDVPIENLREIHSDKSTIWNGYRIEYVARKYLQLTHIDTKRSMRLWDVIGFFQGSFVFSIETWLGITDKVINKGKKSRSSFNSKDLEFIISYCQKELFLFEKLMQRLWECLDAVGIKLNRWDGAGAVAACLLQMNGTVKYKGTPEQNDIHYELARCAYAGGRFELFRPGDFQCKVYNYDINSAYPYGIAQLPAFNGLTKCKAKDHSKCTIGKFDLVHVEYNGDYRDTIHPYFHRDDHYGIAYPINHKGWHWAVEYLSAYKHGRGGSLTHHYKLSYNPRVRPFSWVATMYDKRRALKASGDRAELAIKLGLNSLYGKMVQQKGWRPGKPIPSTHQLYWGGWVTALTRSMLYDAMMQNPEAIIAVETDGIFTTAELDLPLSKAMGEWGIKIYENMTYVQSGMYFGTLAEGHYKPEDGPEVAKYRGLDKGSLTRASVIKGWEKWQHDRYSKNITKLKQGCKVKAKSTRFRTLGTSLAGEQRISQWCQWRTETKEIDIKITGKRKHWCSDLDCNWGKGHSHTTLSTQPDNEESVGYNVLWIDTADKVEMFRILEEEWESDICDN